MKSRERRLIGIVAALALCAGITFSVLWNPDDPFRVRRTPSTPPAEEEWMAQAGEEAELVLRFEWGDGTIGRIARRPLPEELAGLSALELSERRPEWRVESFSPREIVVSQPCQKDQEGFLGVSGGYVAIFDGSPDGCSRLREVTDIALQDLPSFQVADLRRGIAFRNDVELGLILEGIRVP